MLIKTIKMETQDDTLFSKAAPLLTAAAELCYHTVNCSALNAEELRREMGIEVGSAIYGRFLICKVTTYEPRKPSNVGEFDGCQENVRKLIKGQEI